MMTIVVLSAMVIGALAVVVSVVLMRMNASRGEASVNARLLCIAGGVVMVAAAGYWLVTQGTWGVATAGPGKMQQVVHRAGAGMRDSNGWYVATSTEGKFSVVMPAPFKDLTSQGLDADGRAVKAFVLVAQAGTNTRFVVQLLDIAGKDATNEPSLRQFEQDLASVGKISTHKKCEVQGCVGVDSIARGNAGSGQAMLFMRRVRAPEGLYMMSVTCLARDAMATRQAVAYYFESLQRPAGSGAGK